MATSKSTSGYKEYTKKVIEKKISDEFDRLTKANSKKAEKDQHPTQLLNIAAHGRVFASIKDTSAYSTPEARAIILQHLISTCDVVNNKIDDIIQSHIGDYRTGYPLPIVESSENYSIKIGETIYGSPYSATNSEHCSLIEDCKPEVVECIELLVYQMLRTVPYTKYCFSSLKSAISERLAHEQSSGYTGGRMDWRPINPGTTTPGTATLLFTSMNTFKPFLVRASLIPAIENATTRIEKRNAKANTTENPSEA